MAYQGTTCPYAPITSGDDRTGFGPRNLHNDTLDIGYCRAVRETKKTPELSAKNLDRIWTCVEQKITAPLESMLVVSNADTENAQYKPLDVAGWEMRASESPVNTIGVFAIFEA